MGGSDDESSELLSSSSRLGAREVRYKGLAKNEAQLYSLFGLANLVICNQKMEKGPATPATNYRTVQAR
jgi:hypothetical protein